MQFRRQKSMKAPFTTNKEAKTILNATKKGLLGFVFWNINDNADYLANIHSKGRIWKEIISPPLDPDRKHIVRNFENNNNFGKTWYTNRSTNHGVNLWQQSTQWIKLGMFSHFLYEILHCMGCEVFSFLKIKFYLV